MVVTTNLKGILIYYISTTLTYMIKLAPLIQTRGTRREGYYITIYTKKTNSPRKREGDSATTWIEIFPPPHKTWGRSSRPLPLSVVPGLAALQFTPARLLTAAVGCAVVTSSSLSSKFPSPSHRRGQLFPALFSLCSSFPPREQLLAAVKVMCWVVRCWQVGVIVIVDST